jgi:tetratricopeptide (TPR) repeat protein
VLVLAFGIVASHPLERFAAFKVSPVKAEAIQNGDFVTAHLLSGNGSGRWQFWSSAIDEWRAHPFLGEGAGSYGHWWAEHASFTYFLKDAHSLYLETLGELGIVGFILVVALALVGIVVGARRSLRSAGEDRITTAALTAVFAGYAVAVGFDWMWELTAVSVVGLVALALLSGPATDVYEPLQTVRAAEPPRPGSSHRVALGVVVGLAAWILICAEAIPLLADREIARSRSAVGRGDLAEAAVAAQSARDIQPWAATPYLQLALVREQQGALPEARAWIEKAIARDSRDWQLWLVAARLDTKLGHVAAADRTLRRAAQLNPRSPLFEGLVNLSSARR